MSEKKYVVPSGMLEAAVSAMREPSGPKFRSTEQWAACGLEAAVRWLAENPVVPSDELANKLWGMAHNARRLCEYPHAGKQFAVDLQRRMFLAPEPAVPEAVKDLVTGYREGGDAYNAVLEAYNRGLKAGK